jgi:hypothetical protein
VRADRASLKKWLRENALPADSVIDEPMAAGDGAPDVEPCGKIEKSPPSRRGALPKYNWDTIHNEFFRLMDVNGKFNLENPPWNCQARLEEELMNFCGKNEPGLSTLREKIPGWLTEWREQNGQSGINCWPFLAIPGRPQSAFTLIIALNHAVRAIYANFQLLPHRPNPQPHFGQSPSVRVLGRLYSPLAASLSR